MEWFQVLIIIFSTTGTSIGMFLYLASKIDKLSSDTTFKIDKLSSEINKEMKEFRELWAKESKDFHGRLCAIEERRK